MLAQSHENAALKNQRLIPKLDLISHKLNPVMRVGTSSKPGIAGPNGTGASGSIAKEQQILKSRQATSMSRSNNRKNEDIIKLLSNDESRPEDDGQFEMEQIYSHSLSQQPIGNLAGSKMDMSRTAVDIVKGNIKST